MQRGVYLVAGVCLILFGALLFTVSFQNITGLVVIDESHKTNFEFAGTYFIIGGVFSLFLSRKRKKGQAAMEFLMTYGWAILAAIVAIGVLAYLGVFSPDGLGGNNGFMGPPFYLNAEGTGLDGVTIELTNEGPEVYTIRKIKIDGCGEFNALIPISAGTTEILNLPCDLPEGNFKAGITISYTKQGSILELTSSGKMVSQTEGAVNLVPNWLMSLPDDLNWLDTPDQTLVFDYNNIESYSHDSAETGVPDQCFKWAGTPLIPADSSKAYKYSIWIKSTDTEMDNLFGFLIYDQTRAQITGAWSNQYSYFKDTEGDLNSWQKFEGFLGPSSAGSANECDSSLTNGNDWCMASNTAYLIMRFGSCYSTGSDGHTYYMYPRIEEISWPPS